MKLLFLERLSAEERFSITSLFDAEYGGNMVTVNRN